jgi:hypothetical protein
MIRVLIKKVIINVINVWIVRGVKVAEIMKLYNVGIIKLYDKKGGHSAGI